MNSNGISNAALAIVPEKAKPKTVQGYGAWALALLIAGSIAIGMISAIYTAAFKPMERQLGWIEAAAALDAEIAAEIPMPNPLPAPPEYEMVQANTGLCVRGSISYVSCVRGAFDRANAENDRRRKKTRAAQEKVSQRRNEISAAEEARAAARSSRLAEATTRRPFIKRLAARWQFWVGLVLLGGSIAATATRVQPTLPAHRDPRGAAVEALKADHAAGGAAITVAGAAGVALLATLHSFGALVIVGGIAGLVAWGAVNGARKHRLAAAGFRVADQQWQAAAAAAERAGKPVPPEPRVAVPEAQTLGNTGGFVAPEGSAMATLLDEAGRPNPAVAAWNRIAQAMGLGSTDASGRFVPWAQLEHATWYTDTGDVELAFRLEDVTKTAADLNRVAGPLLREMRVRSLIGGAFTPRHTDGRVVGRFTNNVDAPAPVAGPATVDDDWDF